jgi:DNA-binding XRE family transcriptional regulator
MANPEGSDSMRMWGSLHKGYRNAAGLTYEDVAKHVGYSPSLVISIERGVRMPSETYIPRADEILHAGGVLIRAAEHLSRQRYPVWFEDYVTEEQRARVLWTYCTHMLHGLVKQRSTPGPCSVRFTRRQSRKNWTPVWRPESTGSCC